MAESRKAWRQSPSRLFLGVCPLFLSQVTLTHAMCTERHDAHTTAQGFLSMSVCDANHEFWERIYPMAFGTPAQNVTVCR